MNVGIWYDPVTTEAELKITKMIKQQRSRQWTPWNLHWTRSGQKKRTPQSHFSWEKIHPMSLFAWTWGKNHDGEGQVTHHPHGGIQHDDPLEDYIEGVGTHPRSQSWGPHDFPPEWGRWRRTGWAPTKETKADCNATAAVTLNHLIPTNASTPKKRQHTWGRKISKVVPWISKMVSPICILLMMMTPVHQRLWVALSLNISQAPTFPDLTNYPSTRWTRMENFKNWILLDNQSTVQLFSNTYLICNILPESDPVDVHSSGGMI